jgi:hypothetical protein
LQRRPYSEILHPPLHCTALHCTLDTSLYKHQRADPLLLLFIWIHSYPLRSVLQSETVARVLLAATMAFGLGTSSGVKGGLRPRLSVCSNALSSSDSEAAAEQFLERALAAAAATGFFPISRFLECSSHVDVHMRAAAWDFASSCIANALGAGGVPNPTAPNSTAHPLYVFPAQGSQLSLAADGLA